MAKRNSLPRVRRRKWDVPPPPLVSDTVEHARRWVRDNREMGVTCPVCEKHAQEYHRPLNAGIARDLLRLYRFGAGPEGWSAYLHLARQEGISREISKAVWWGLVEAMPGTREDGGAQGYWRLTGHGRAFVEGRVTVMSHAIEYDGRCTGSSGLAVTFAQVLGEPFDLRDLLGREPAPGRVLTEGLAGPTGGEG